MENISVDLTFKQLGNAILSLLIENLAQNRLLFEELLALRVRTENGLDNVDAIKSELTRYEEKIIEVKYELTASILNTFSKFEKVDSEKFISETVAQFEVFLTDFYKNTNAQKENDNFQNNLDSLNNASR